MKKVIVNLLLSGLFLAIASCESKKNEDSKDVAEEQNKENLEDTDLKKDSEFAVEAADGGLLEVQLGTMALARSGNQQVKEFAQMMVNDHGKANAELKSLAGQKGIVLPDVMSEKYQKKYYDLDQKKNAAEFDKEYIDLMVSDHKEDINKFEKEANNGNDPEIKAFASEKLPVLRHHLSQAENVQKALKDDKRNN